MRGSKHDQRIRRHDRLRRRVTGTAERPRLQVRRTLHHLYAFIVDDAKGHTIAAASTLETALASGLSSRTNLEAARKLGAAIGEKAKSAGITSVVFDRAGMKFHGRVKAIADAAREAGLEF
ncbi:MAG: 50S ribosomal protein L18 [Candidatus Eremiobacteraeota bacterium]|nr:50S ribosomal protein L18 [Candidatus Eremiobacteraeota bacterium]